MSTEEINPLNSNEIEQENLVNNNIQEEVNDIDYFSKFIWPEESDNDDEDNDWFYFYGNSNDDMLIDNILTRQQLLELDRLEKNNCQRSKRSNKKVNAQRQIKTKHCQSIKYNSHNKHLYIHHRIYKQIDLDPPSRNFISSSSQIPTYSLDEIKTKHQQQIPIQTKPSPPHPSTQPINQFREYTIPHDPCFDDAMIRFLLDMQNRDLCPEDYEMLLRLDERVQRKTIDKNIFNSLPTIKVDQQHLNDLCTICMEEYILGQSLKLLPCKHIFHTNCIETYLKEFSVQCPLDNLPLT